MHKKRVAIVSIFAAAALAACTLNSSQTAKSDSTPRDDGWKPLFNGKNLDGFYVYLDKSLKDHDDKGVFRVEDGMIHVMDLPPSTATQETGYFATEKEYGDFDLRFEYKWGTKKFAPRATQPRDSGCHYLFTGADKVWENAVECQVQEGETGDVYLLNGAYTAQTTVKSAADRTKTYDPNGTASPVTGTRLMRSETVDSPTDWNKVEVIVKDNSSTHIVNGHTVAHLENITTRDGKPVTQGKIAFQSEAAELYFRNIEIKTLK